LSWCAARKYWYLDTLQVRKCTQKITICKVKVFFARKFNLRLNLRIIFYCAHSFTLKSWGRSLYIPGQSICSPKIKYDQTFFLILIFFHFFLPILFIFPNPSTLRMWSHSDWHVLNLAHTSSDKQARRKNCHFKADIKGFFGTSLFKPDCYSYYDNKELNVKTIFLYRDLGTCVCPFLSLSDQCKVGSLPTSSRLSPTLLSNKNQRGLQSNVAVTVLNKSQKTHMFSIHRVFVSTYICT
jgi:hypothetical protein